MQPNNQTHQTIKCSTQEFDGVWKGSIEQIVTNVVQQYWKLKVDKIVHMVGYDVMNFLITVSANKETVSDLPQLSAADIEVDKYVVKVYRKCTKQQMQVILAENYLLQQINEQTTLYDKYPQPIPLSTCEEVRQPSSILDVPTDKNIMYTLNQNSIHVPNLDQVVSSHSIQLKLVHKSNPNSCIDIDMVVDKYVQSIRIEMDGSVQTAQVRVLKYIPGVMLGTIIQDMDRNSDPSKQAEYQVVIREKVPIFIAQSITTPLYRKTQLYQQQQYDSVFMKTLKNRQWEWHIESFLNLPQFYKQRHALIASNTDRPPWHSELIEYFVQLYIRVKQELNKCQECSKIRKSIIHNDTNEWNIVVSAQKYDKNSPISIIDFGDAVYSYLIEDISIYTLYVIYNHPTRSIVEEDMLQIISSYTSVMPITYQELQLFLVTIPMRMCVSLCNSQFAMRDRPQDSYVSMSQKNGWTLLQVLKDMIEDGAQGSIFDSILFKKLKQMAKIQQKINQKQENEIESDSSKYGQHWTTQQQFWEEECAKDSKQSYAAFEKKEAEHLNEIMEKYYPHIIKKNEGADCKIIKMNGYFTKNFKISYLGQNKINYTMKIYKNLKRLQSYVQMESIVQNHLITKQKQNIDQNSDEKDFLCVKLPEPIKSNEQTNSFCVTFYDPFWKCDVLVRLLTYIEGQPLDYFYDKVLKIYKQDFFCEKGNKYKINMFYEVLGSMGSMLGNLHILLQSSLQQLRKIYEKKQLYSMLARKDYQWNFDQVNIWKKYIKFVKDSEVKEIIEKFVELFQQNVILTYKAQKRNKIAKEKILRKKLVHMDPNEGNALISEPYSAHPKIDAIIDFDDIQIDFLVADLACTLAHCLHKPPKVRKLQGTHKYELHQAYKTGVSSFVSAYHRINPLNDEQIRCLYYFLTARIGMCITLESRDIQNDPGNQHINFDFQWLCQYLKSLSLIHPDQFQTLIHQACSGKQKAQQ